MLYKYKFLLTLFTRFQNKDPFEHRANNIYTIKYGSLQK